MDMGKNISERNIIGIKISIAITLATRGDLATLPIALPKAKKVIMPKIDIPIKAAHEPRTLTSKASLPTTKRTTTPRAININ